MTPRHATALEYAACGVPVFPCLPGAKRPATAHAFYDRSADPEVINAWWQERDYNIGVVPDDLGCVVIDLDGVLGEAAWAAFLAEGPVDQPLWHIRTPSGGRHLWFSGSLRPSAGKLGPGIDIRSQGSYVLVPPSVVDGREYVLIQD